MGNVIIHNDFQLQTTKRGELVDIKFQDINEDGTHGDLHVYPLDIDDAVTHARDVQKKSSGLDVVTEMPKGPHAP